MHFFSVGIKDEKQSINDSGKLFIIETENKGLMDLVPIRYNNNSRNKNLDDKSWPHIILHWLHCDTEKKNLIVDYKWTFITQKNVDHFQPFFSFLKLYISDVSSPVTYQYRHFTRQE